MADNSGGSLVAVDHDPFADAPSTLDDAWHEFIASMTTPVDYDPFTGS